MEERDVDATLLPALLADPPACVVPMLHGETGEDGAVREVLELLDVPYVGARPEACRVSFDKPVAKTLALRAGLRTPEGMVGRKYFHKSGVLPLEYCWPPGHGLPGWLLRHLYRPLIGPTARRFEHELRRHLASNAVPGLTKESVE